MLVTGMVSCQNVWMPYVHHSFVNATVGSYYLDLLSDNLISDSQMVTRVITQKKTVRMSLFFPWYI